MRLNEYLLKKKKLVDGALHKFLPKAQSAYINKVVRYSVFAGGKRFRPVLMLAVAEALRGSEAQILPAACAVELVHTFTLVHDDLPCMDDDDYRRGKLTAHKKFGEHLAVLSGDALQSLAYEIMLTKTRRVAPAQLLAALRILLEAIGPKGVVAGQVLDLEAEGQVISFLRLKQIHAQKTGALIRAAVKMAAVLCHASEKTAAKLDLYARHLGLLFQIADDLLDYTSSFAKMGKNPGSDLKQGKATYVSVLGQEQAGVFLLKEGQAARAALKFLGKRAARLQQLVDYAAAREG